MHFAGLCGIKLKEKVRLYCYFPRNGHSFWDSQDPKPTGPSLKESEGLKHQWLLQPPGPVKHRVAPCDQIQQAECSLAHQVLSVLSAMGNERGGVVSPLMHMQNMRFREVRDSPQYLDFRPSGLMAGFRGREWYNRNRSPVISWGHQGAG